MLTLGQQDYPGHLNQLDQIPEHLFYLGASPANWAGMPRLAVVGSRRATAYGQAATKKLVEESARAGVAIISGLALGIDGLAHKSALDANGLTIAVLPGGLDRIYPASHHSLAQQIIRQNGTLISEYPAGTPAFKYSFIARNRIIASLATAVLITEASLASGSLHTASFAMELGIPVLAVPGSIYSANSQGTNQLIKSGAQMAEDVRDIFMALGYRSQKSHKNAETLAGLTAEQSQLLSLIKDGLKDQDELLSRTKTDYKKMSASLTWLEINGLIRPLGNGQWVAF